MRYIEIQSTFRIKSPGASKGKKKGWIISIEKELPKPLYLSVIANSKE